MQKLSSPYYVLTWALIFFLTIALLWGIFNPLYSDEITLRILHARYFTDFGQTETLTPQCFPLGWEMPRNPIQAIYDIFESLLYSKFLSPLIIRIFGIIKAIVAMFMFGRIVGLIIGKNISEQNPMLQLALTLSVFAFGVSPYLFVINRTEQELLLAILGTVALFLTRAEKESSVALQADILRTIAFCLLLLLAFSPHPNALLFAPFFALAAWHIPARSIIRPILLFLVGLIIVNEILYMSALIGCPSDPVMRQELKVQTLSPSLFLSAPFLGIAILLRNLFASSKYISNILYKPEYEVGWIPRHNFDHLHMFSNLITIIIIASLFLLTAIASALVIRKIVCRIQLDLREQLMLAISFSIFGLICLQIAKPWYTTGLVLPVIGLTTALSWQVISSTRAQKILSRWPAVVVISGIASLVLFFVTFGGDPFQNYMKDRTHESDKNSFSGFGYSQQLAQIQKLAVDCGIRLDNFETKLAVDDMTYWALKSTRLPIDIYYVGRIYNKRPDLYNTSIGSIKKFLRDRSYAGIIVRCDELMERNIQFESKRLGVFCCKNLLEH